MQTAEYKFTNRLINETSPYLLTHAHNPVDWNAWNENSLTEAQENKKLLIISIGYSACHWCHVMERESFENEEVAEIMNDNFISIKVDREERPDIDQIYMNAAMLINGSGGWPLNAIALPDGRPIYAGTYFPKENWMKLLNQISSIWKQEPEKLIEQADAITAGINKSEVVAFKESSTDFTEEDVKKITAGILQNIDFHLGGTIGQPKFPLPVGYDYLMDYHFHTNDERSLEAVEITLKQMALGGIYDQIGGGFARYSVDKYWHAPHFEKMLYDNAQLISLYSNAFRVTQNPLYKTIVYETIGFVKRELTSKEGGFYSALDADSEGEEGKFYVWDYEEVENVLGEKASIAKDYFNILENGNWEGKNILHPRFTPAEYAQKHSLNYDNFVSNLSNIKSLLLNKRESRIRPSLDDKILTSWNGLMLKALVIAYNVFNEPEFLDLATNNAMFQMKYIIKSDGRLDRNFKNEKSTINAYLDDYANLIDGLIELYQATFEEKWILTARKILDYTMHHFLDKSNGMYFYTSSIDKALIARKCEINDNVLPGSNSVMAWNLFKLGKLYGEPDLIDASKQMLKNVFHALKKGNFYYANWSRLLLVFVYDSFEIVILGKDYAKIKNEFNNKFLPNSIFAGGGSEGELPINQNRSNNSTTLIYTCKNNTCSLPKYKVEETLGEILPS